MTTVIGTISPSQIRERMGTAATAGERLMFGAKMLAALVGQRAAGIGVTAKPVVV